jgi:hemerythrin-like domain-containing protein
MKRSPALFALSREHHAALVWAKRAKALGGHEPSALMAQLAAFFERELEPHFQAEENGLLAVLAQRCEYLLVERALAEHQALRRAIERIEAGDSEAVLPFGVALAAHVRFEERELFPVAEERLSPDLLAAKGGNS